jgi:hypothetical protein
MTKRYRELVDVAVDGEPPAGAGRPTQFRWRGSLYRVLAVYGHWREDAGYWSGGGIEVPQRDLWRVEARNGTPSSTGVYELVREGRHWRLDRIWD